MEEEVKYTSEFDGQTTDEVLKHAKSVKDLTIPSLSNISGFVCIDNEGKAIGMMSKEQVAQVVGELIGLATTKKHGLMDNLDVYKLKPQLLVNPGESTNKVIQLFSSSNGYNSTAVYEIVGNANYKNSESVYITFRGSNVLANIISGIVKVYRDEQNNIYCSAVKYAFLGIRLCFISSGDVLPIVNKLVDKSGLSLTELTNT